MRRPSKRALLALGLPAAAALAAVLAWGLRKPLEQQVLSADHLEYIAEAFPSDGGSRVFFFLMHPPQRHPLALMVPHRNSTLGGNAQFQEIWLDRGGGFATHTAVQPSSALEAKLIQLLQAARINTNVDLHIATHPASPESLKWVAERIRDRKAAW